MSLKSDLRDARSPVGAWARAQFPRCRDLYARLRAASEPIRVVPVGWEGPADQRRSWAGTASGTMLRWLLGDTGPDMPTMLGAARVLTGSTIWPVEDALAEVVDLADTYALAHLVLRPPDLDDLEHAARVAVLWAMAEQHFRYGPTVEPTDRQG